jgi:5'-nucleotidase
MHSISDMKITGLFFLILLALNVSAQTEYINIFHFNDLHGRIEKLPRMQFMADSITKADGGYTVVLSAGDMFSGKPYVDKHELPGWPAIDLMNDFPVNATALGNHEFDYGLKILNERIAKAAFPFVAANVSNGDSALQNVKDYFVIKTPRGNRLVILGLTQVSRNGLPEAHPDRVKGLKFAHGLDRVKDYTHLPGKKAYLIVLSHMGFKNDSILASQMEQAKLIIGGHSHTTLHHPYTGKYADVLQAGQYGRYMGYYRIQMKKGKVISKEYRLLKVDDGQNENKKMKTAADTYIHNPAFNEVVADIPQTITGSVKLASVMALAYRIHCHADLAVQNQGGVRINELPAGPVTVKKMYELDPFDNSLLIVEMTPDDIRYMIEQSINLQGEYDLAPAGFAYEIIKKENGTASEIRLDFLNTMPNKSGKFRMAINSYVFFAYLKDRELNYAETGLYSTQILMDFVKKTRLAEPVKVLIPEKSKGKY